MEQKKILIIGEILKVSLIVGIVTSLLIHTQMNNLLGTLFPWSDQAFFTTASIIGVLASGFILNKKLQKSSWGSEWGVFVGMILTLITTYLALIIEIFLMLLLGAFFL